MIPCPDFSRVFRLTASLTTKYGLLGLVGAFIFTASADEPSGSNSLAIDVAAIEYERQLQAEVAEQRQLEMRQAVARAAAHARMPSTMYASTPSNPNKVPHAMPRSASQLDDIVDLVMPRYLESVTDAASKPFSERWNQVLRTIQAVEQSRGRRDVTGDGLRPQHPDGVNFSASELGRADEPDRLVLPYFPSASDPSDREGLLRLVNRSSRVGEVRIEAIDDTGTTYAPLTFSLDAASVLQLNSAELEQGNAAKGLHAGTGPGQGAWVLALSSTVPMDTYAYIQSSGGYVTPINDTAPSEDSHAIVTYPTSADDTDLQNMLRLVNRNAETVAVEISQVDELGSRKSGVTVELRAHQARTYSLDELATGETPGVSGFSDEFSGRARRVVIESIPGVLAMSFAISNAGHLTHLSGLSTGQETRSVPLFMSASDLYRRQGLIRVVNRENRAGTLGIQAFDDSGRKYEAITLALDANSVVEVDSNDLELGNPAKGLPTGTGAGEGDWRLEFASELDLEIAAFVRTPDGLRTPMHDTVTGTENRYEIAWFKAFDDTEQVGVLRLINASHQPVDVTIQGTDDAGERHGVARLTIAPNAARTLTAMELEKGTEQLSGMLGDGRGDWRLAITTDTPIEVMNLLSTTTGHLTNLTTPALSIGSSQSSDAEETAESVFESDISPIIQDDCIECHVAGGRADQISRLVFVDDDDPDHLSKNLGEFQALLDEEDADAQHILNKIQNIGGHGGGVRIRAGTDEFKAMVRFLELLGEEVEEGPSITPETLFEGVTLESDRQTLRRAAIVFAGRVPTDDEYASLVDGDEDSLRVAIRGLMQGPGFHDFLIRASNDRLLTDRELERGSIIENDGRFVDYDNKLYELQIEANSQGDDRELWRWQHGVQYGAGRSPLELIAYVAENDLPYTSVFTADFIMANPMSSEAYGASREFNDFADVSEFAPVQIERYFRIGKGHEAEYDPSVGKLRVLDPGPLSTDYPHAGILNTKAFLQRYPTTATNRNRARSRWSYYHFLGLDIEKSASRETDPIALADTNNPTMHNPACTVCHTELDPVAGAFQNYGDDGLYRDQWGGWDSIDSFYKTNPTGGRKIEIGSRERGSVRIDLGSVRLFAASDNELGLKNVLTFEGEVKLQIGLGEVTVLDLDGNEVDRFEVADVVSTDDCGERSEEGYKLWDCAELLVLPLSVSVDGDYEIQIDAWIMESGDKPGTLSYWIPGPFYRNMDTWYRDMRAPGMADEVAPHAENSLQWLGEKIINHPEFSNAVVRFWWPAIFGSTIVEPPSDEADTNYDGLLLASNAQSNEVERLAMAFEQGFFGGPAYNLKDLLVELVLSSWFRAETHEGDDHIRAIALRDVGAKRLLTPEELARKTLSLTGFQWGRGRGAPLRLPHEQDWNALTDRHDGYRLIYGGIDSDGVTERASDLTSLMAGVVQSHAVESSCPIVLRELYLLSDEDRLLLAGIDPSITPVSEFSVRFQISAESWEHRQTLELVGPLSTGLNKVTFVFPNDDGGEDGDRNVRLYWIRVLDADQNVVIDSSLKNLMPPVAPWGECGGLDWNSATQAEDHFNLSSTCRDRAIFEFDVIDTGLHTIELEAWADQYGDELAQLDVAVNSDSHKSAGSRIIKTKLAELHGKLLGNHVSADSAEVASTYELFVELWQDSNALDPMYFPRQKCAWDSDSYFFDGIEDGFWSHQLDDANYEIGWDWDKINPFWEDLDRSDPNGVAETWAATMTYLLMDYRYLHL